MNTGPRRAAHPTRSNDLPGRAVTPPAGRRGPGDGYSDSREVRVMRNAGPVLDVLRDGPAVLSPRSPRRNRWRASCWETSLRGSDRGSLEKDPPLAGTSPAAYRCGERTWPGLLFGRVSGTVISRGGALAQPRHRLRRDPGHRRLSAIPARALNSGPHPAGDARAGCCERPCEHTLMPRLRREALCYIPGVAGRDSKGGSWV